MGDIAQILGVTENDVARAEPPRATKLQGLPKKVLSLIGTTSHGDGALELPTSVPASTYVAAGTKTNKTDSVIKVGNKWISASKPARKWVWAPFSSSARTDGLLLHHWVRNVEYPDYPYARFNIHLDPVTYNNDEEYRAYLQDPDWSKSETDQLLELVKRLELRWPVIYDRWTSLYEYGGTSDLDTPKHRKIEDLQHRYYSIAAILMQTRISREAAAEAQSLATQTAAIAGTTTSATVDSVNDSKQMTDSLLIETAAARALASVDPLHQPIMHNIGSGTSNKVAFDLNYERERRSHMEALWNRTKEEELEEAELRKELKLVEAQLRKMKKSGAHILAAGNGSASGTLSSAASSRAPSRAATPVAQMGGGVGGGADPLTTGTASMDQAFATTAPTAVAGTPYLQSGRLLPPTIGGAMGINKTLRSRMEQVLEEMGISKNPLPTKRVCDLFDAVRRDVLTLLILQKTALQKEGLLANKRFKLAKRGGNVRVVDEETLLGIVPQLSSASQTPAARGGAKVVRIVKGGKGSAVGANKSKSSTKAKPGETVDPSVSGADVKNEASASSTVIKQVPAGTTLGVKQVRRPSVPTKRKRKPVDASNMSVMSTSTSIAVAAATVPVAAVVASQDQPSLDSAVVVGHVMTASETVSTGPSDTTLHGKKRAKKSIA